MKIAIDFDGTFAEDPGMFGDIVQCMQDHGHKVYIVTNRLERQKKFVEEVVLSECEASIIYAGAVPKAYYMKEQGIDIDLWIDDKPESIK